MRACRWADGKKVLVRFHRLSGCPDRPQQVHDPIEDQEALNAAGIETTVVLHSNQEKMRTNFDEVPGLHLIADPQKPSTAPTGRNFSGGGSYRPRPGARRSPPSPADTCSIRQVLGRGHRHPLRLPPRGTRHDRRHPDSEKASIGGAGCFVLSMVSFSFLLGGGTVCIRAFIDSS
jgi:hypothetical protein